MPSAANVKIDKQISGENALADSSSSCSNSSTAPLRQAITIIEHKIRNLEKRKAKLESYRDLQNAGKELNGDQKTAVAKYGEVVQTLEFARDLCKQFLGITTTTEKEAKKQAKREAAARQQADLAKLREVLLIQDALNILGISHVREDFLNGRRGAAQLTQADLELLDELYPAVTPKHEAGNPTAFTNEVQSSAEHLLAVVDGKSKEVFGGSYSQIKEILGKIHESGYLDQVQEEEVQEAYVESYVEEDPSVLTEVPILNSDSMVPDNDHMQQIPPIETLTIEANMPPTMGGQQQGPEQQVLDQPLHVEPSLGVAGIGNDQQQQPVFFQPVQAPQQPVVAQQPPRPIAEMLGTGSFYFLQESEIDTAPEQIPSQTFTNQSFVATPAPPIPLPPHFQNIPPSSGLPPAVVNLPPSGAPVTAGKNGLDDIAHNQQPTIEDPPLKQQPPAASNRPPRQSQNQAYYQNNNSYNNSRPRQRSGGRPNNNSRH